MIDLDELSDEVETFTGEMEAESDGADAGDLSDIMIDEGDR